LDNDLLGETRTKEENEGSSNCKSRMRERTTRPTIMQTLPEAGSTHERLTRVIKVIVGGWSGYESPQKMDVV
jgi:hypothetical protein